MNASQHSYTIHALKRIQERCIPLPVVELIVSYGTSRNAGHGARKFGLDKSALTEIREDFGKTYSRKLERFRNAYVVSCDGKIITTAFANSPIFH